VENNNVTIKVQLTNVYKEPGQFKSKQYPKNGAYMKKARICSWSRRTVVVVQHYLKHIY
jgi:hypothetical protein